MAATWWWVEANEDPKLAVVREAKEEAGVNIKTTDLQLLDSIFKVKEDYLFLIFGSKERYSESEDYSVQDEEIEEYKFVAPQDVSTFLPAYYEGFCKTYLA